MLGRGGGGAVMTMWHCAAVFFFRNAELTQAEYLACHNGMDNPITTQHTQWNIGLYMCQGGGGGRGGMYHIGKRSSVKETYGHTVSFSVQRVGMP